MVTSSPAKKKIPLSKLARESASFGREFTDTLRSEGLKTLKAAEDILVLNHSADFDSGLEVVESLRDLRSSLMVVYDRVEDGGQANLKEAKAYKESLRPGDGVLREAEQVPQPPKDGYDSVVKHLRSEKTKLNVPSGRAAGLAGLGAFIKDLTGVIGVSAAAAALPPGPMSVSVGSFAKEQASSQSQSRFSGRSSGYRESLLSHGGHSSSISGSSESNSDYSKVSTDERILGVIDDLKLRLEQMGTHDATKMELTATRGWEVTGHKDRKFWFDKDQVLSNSGYKRPSESRVLEEREYHMEHPKLPLTGIIDYQ